MKKFNWLVIWLVLTAVVSGQDVKQFHHEALYTVVRVRADKSGGSGTVIYSKKDTMGRWRTFVMTNHHVVAELIEVKEQWDSLLQKDIKGEITKTAFVEFFKYNNLSRFIGSFAVEADVIAYDKRHDVAILELRDRENQAPSVAHLFPRDKIDSEVFISDPQTMIYAIGASLGHAPLSTRGDIAFLDDEIENVRYWLSTALTIYGNSGGSVFRWSKERRRFEFLGIPARITVMGLGFSEQAITHLGYMIPLDRIYDWLDSQFLQFLYDPKVTVEQSEKLRADKRQKARLSVGFP